MVPFLLPLCDHRVGFHRCMVREWYNPSASAAVTCLNATARTRRAARVVQSDVLSVWQGLQWDAQRTAHFCATCCPI
jgi:hypothetical protein